MKKKILAILLASVMVFALASPAMADGETHTVTCENDGHGTCSIVGSNQFAQGETVNVQVNPEAGYVFAELDVIENGYNYVYYDVTPFTMHQYDVTVKAYFVPEENVVNRVDVTIDTSIGTNICNATKTVTTDIGDGVVAIDESRTMWVRWAPGANPETDEPELILTGSSDVFEEGYTYACYIIVDIVDVENYRFAFPGAELYINGVATENDLSGNKELSVGQAIVLATTPAKSADSTTSAEDTTAAPTTTATETTATSSTAVEDTTAATTTTSTTTATETTATSTAVETGDSTNAIIYVIALIVLIAGAGVTIFATKKSK